MNNNNLIIMPTGSRLWASYFYNLLIGKPIFITVFIHCINIFTGIAFMNCINIFMMLNLLFTVVTAEYMDGNIRNNGQQSRFHILKAYQGNVYLGQ